MGSGAEGFEQLFALEYQPVARTVFLICFDHARAEEITQDAFVELLRHWDRVSTFDRPGAWVRRVAIRLAMRSLHRETLRRRAELTFQPQGPATGLDVDVMKAVAALPLRQRTAVVLFYFEQCTLTEIADVLGCSPSTAGVHLHRGRGSLGRLLEEVGSDEVRRAGR